MPLDVLISSKVNTRNWKRIKILSKIYHQASTLSRLFFVKYDENKSKAFTRVWFLFFIAAIFSNFCHTFMLIHSFIFRNKEFFLECYPKITNRFLLPFSSTEMLVLKHIESIDALSYHVMEYIQQKLTKIAPQLRCSH